MATGYPRGTITYFELLLETVTRNCNGVELVMEGAVGSLKGLEIASKCLKVALECFMLCGEEVVLLFGSGRKLVAGVVSVATSVLVDALVSSEVIAEVFNELILDLAPLSLALELSLQYSELLLELIVLSLGCFFLRTYAADRTQRP